MSPKQQCLCWELTPWIHWEMRMAVKGTPENFSDNLAKTEGRAHHPILEMVDCVLPCTGLFKQQDSTQCSESLPFQKLWNGASQYKITKPPMVIHGVRDTTQVQHPAKPHRRLEFGSRRHFLDFELCLALNLTCCLGRVGISDVILVKSYSELEGHSFLSKMNEMIALSFSSTWYWSLQSRISQSPSLPHCFHYLKVKSLLWTIHRYRLTNPRKEVSEVLLYSIVWGGKTGNIKGFYPQKR